MAKYFKVFDAPIILRQTDAFLVVYKPPRMHSATITRTIDGTLFDWVAARFPEVCGVQGKNPRDGGLLHRLDFETGGLLAVARTQAAFDAISLCQDEGRFVKSYTACAMQREGPQEKGFPSKFPWDSASDTQNRAFIESGFRPWGPGRKAVRPISAGKVSEPSRIYTTYIDEVRSDGGSSAHIVFSVRLTRGFRHQIRCHLAWAGFPLINDEVYGGQRTDGLLGLCADGLRFDDPETGRTCEFRLDQEAAKVTDNNL
jgi:23S rRNA pseudouridine1911/1915/1917 synthase